MVRAVANVVVEFLTGQRHARDDAFSQMNTTRSPSHSEQAAEEPQTKYPLPPFKAFSQTNINFAVIGESGAGKSSFINAYLGYGPKDDRKAKTGVLETTGVGENEEIKYFEYALPGNVAHKLLFWDLPGCGTVAFPTDEYIKHFGLRHFDLCILISATRFTKAEDDLLSALSGFNVPLFVIRSKFDVDLENHCSDNGIVDEGLNDDEQQVLANSLADSMKSNAKETLPNWAPITDKKTNVVNGTDRLFVLSSRMMGLTLRGWQELMEKVTVEVGQHRHASQAFVDNLKAKFRAASSGWRALPKTAINHVNERTQSQSQNDHDEKSNRKDAQPAVEVEHRRSNTQPQPQSQDRNGRFLRDWNELEVAKYIQAQFLNVDISDTSRLVIDNGVSGQVLTAIYESDGYAVIEEELFASLTKLQKMSLKAKMQSLFNDQSSAGTEKKQK